MTRIEDIDWSLTEPPAPDVPPLRDALSDPTARQRFVRHHVRRRALSWFRAAMIAVLRRLPTRATTGLSTHVFGPFAQRTEGRRPYAHRMADVAHTIAPHRWPAGNPGAFVDAWFANVAHAYSEYCLLDRLIAPDRCAVFGREHLTAARASDRGCIVVTVHTGTWELVSHLIPAHLNNRATATWSPEPDSFANQLIWQARRRVGAKVLSPGPHLPRLLLNVLKVRGQSLVMLVDEISEGKTLFPLFGRPMPQRGNFVFTLRLAQKTGAQIVPFTMERTGPARHTLRYHPPFSVGEGASGLAEAGLRLDAVLGGFVAEHLDQWYMLHNLKRSDVEHLRVRRASA